MKSSAISKMRTMTFTKQVKHRCLHFDLGEICKHISGVIEVENIRYLFCLENIFLEIAKRVLGVIKSICTQDSLDHKRAS